MTKYLLFFFIFEASISILFVLGAGALFLLDEDDFFQRRSFFKYEIFVHAFMVILGVLIGVILIGVALFDHGNDNCIRQHKVATTIYIKGVPYPSSEWVCDETAPR